MIKGYCFTNLDDYDCSLVNVFVAVPSIGDRVRVLYKGTKRTLKVVSITHDFNNLDKNIPCIMIELHN